MRGLVYRLVHYVIWLVELVYGLLRWLPNAQSVKKLPTHIGLLVLEADTSYRDLANLVVWAVSLGVSVISIYDINGEVKRNSVLLQHSIDKSKDEMIGSGAVNYDIQIFPSPNPIIPSSGTAKSQQVHVHLLCVEDGHRHIVGIARHFSHMAYQGMYVIEDIQPHSVDSVIQESLQFPDPDLCLKFGSIESMLGYLPWQIRLTEIISLPTHKGLTYKSFLASLIQYGNTDQRFGK